MRIVPILAAFMLAACASEKLAPAPAGGVDLTGHWKLNEADSDDPLRLMQSQLASATAGAGPSGQTGSSGRGRQGDRGGGLGAAGPAGPVMPSVTILDEALRWPGKDLTLQQKGGLVSFSADGATLACRSAEANGHHHHAADASGHPAARGRGDVPPPACGWDAGTLVVHYGEFEDEHPPFEQRFSLSDDGQRLIEVVSFSGGRSSGFTASRVWDRSRP
jgi:hypothetical protein